MIIMHFGYLNKLVDEYNNSHYIGKKPIDAN